MAADVELAPRRRGLHRQRLPAVVVFVAAFAVVVALSGQSWAELRITSVDDAEAVVDVEMQPTGRVLVDRTDEDADDSLRAAYLDDSLAPQRTVLRESVSQASAEVARVLAAIVALVALAGCMRDLTAPTWVLVSSAALACLVLVVTLRDRLLGTLAGHSAAVDLGLGDTSPTVWGAVAIAGATAAALAAGAAAGPRPVQRRGVRGGRPVPLREDRAALSDDGPTATDDVALTDDVAAASNTDPATSAVGGLRRRRLRRTTAPRDADG